MGKKLRWRTWLVVLLTAGAVGGAVLHWWYGWPRAHEASLPTSIDTQSPAADRQPSLTVKKLLSKLRSIPNPSQQQADEVINELASLGSPAVPTLIEALTLQDNRLVRRSICLSLGRIGDRRATLALLGFEEQVDKSTSSPDYDVYGPTPDTGFAEALGMIWTRQNPLIDLQMLVEPPAALGLRRILAQPKPNTSLDYSDLGPLYQLAEAVARHGELQASEDISAALTRNNHQARIRAAELAGLLSMRQALDALLTMLNSSNEDEQRAAIIALGLIGDHRAISALKPLTMLELNTSAFAMTALGRIGSDQAVEILAERAGSENSGVRGYALSALETIGTPTALAARQRELAKYPDNGNTHEDYKILRQAREMLAKGDPEGGRLAVMLLKAYYTPNDVSEAAEKLLIEFPCPQVKSDLEKIVLGHEGPYPLYAIRPLAALGKASVPTLIKASNGNDSSMAQFAIKALGDIPDADAATALADALKSWERRRLHRSELIDSLTKQGGSIAVNTFAPVLATGTWGDKPDAATTNPDSLSEGAIWNARLDAATSLTRLGPAGQARLVEALKSTNPQTYRVIVHGIANAMNDNPPPISKELRTALVAKLGDEGDRQQGCSLSAAKTLGTIGDPRAMEYLRKQPWFGGFAAKILAKTDPHEAIVYMDTLLTIDQNRDTRREVVAFLVILKGSGLDNALTKVVGDDDEAVAIPAIERLGQLHKTAPLIPELQKALITVGPTPPGNGPYVFDAKAIRRCVFLIRALSGTVDESTRTLLGRLRNHPDMNIRYAASRSLETSTMSSPN